MKPRTSHRTTILWTVLSLILTLAAPHGIAADSKYGISSMKLKNGLEVVTIENHTVPLVTIELAARNGAFTEPPELDGLSHLYEHMFFKANRAIPNQERYLERLRELGATFNATTSAELVNYYITLPRANLREGLEFMRDAIMYPLFKEEELVAERVVVTAEFDRSEASPGFHLFRELGRRLWYKHYSRKNTIGDREVILTASRDKMRTIKDRYYIPNNMALLVAGDVDPVGVNELADEFYAEWERGPNPLRAHRIPKHPPLEKSQTIAVVQPVGAVNLMIGYHGPSMRDDKQATFAADVLSFVLGQPDSKFQRALVDEGHFDGVSLGYSSLVHTGPIYVSARTSADRLDAALAALDVELAKFLEPDYYSETEMETAKSLLEVSEIYSQEMTSEFVHAVAFWWSTGGLEYYLDYIDDLRAVTRKEIDRYVRDYIVDRPRVVSILCTEENLDAIAAAKEAEIVRPEPPEPPRQEENKSIPQAFEVDGLKVILRSNPIGEIVAMGLFFDGGVIFTGEERAGMEYMALEAATKGSESFSKEVIDRELAAMGTSIVSEVGPDSSALRMQCLKRSLDRSWQIFADIIQHPLYEEREVELIRERHLNTIRQRTQNPDSAIAELGRPNYFRGHPYAANPEGTEETISKITAEDLKSFQREAFLRGRARLVVSGAVTREEIEEMVRTGLADLPQAAYSPKGLPLPAGKDNANLATEARELPTNYVLGYHHAPSVDHPDYAAMRVAEHLLRSRLFEEVRTKRSLTYAVSSSIATRKSNFGYLYVSTTKPNETMEVMLAEVRRLGEEPITEKEIRDNKNEIITGYLESNQTNAALVSRLALYESAGGGWQNSQSYLQRIEAVRASDIQRAVKKYIHTISFAVLGDPSSVDANVFSGDV